jgi:CBS domain containing-hemolysin-like protein
MAEDTGLVLIALLLVLLNGFFVASEFAIVKLRSTRVENLRAVHGWRGRILSVVHRRLDAYLSACQLGITLASLGLGWIGEPAFARLLEGPAEWLGLDDDPDRVEAAAFVFAFTTISFLHIVIGELAPKSMAIRMPETVSLWTAIPLWTFFWLMYPFIWVLNASANVMLRWIGLGGLTPDAHESPYSREELRAILHMSRPATEIGERIVTSVVSHALELPDLDVSDLMRPTSELVGFERGATYEEVHRIVREHRFSRYAVFGDDRRVVGVVHLKDLVLEHDGPDYFERLEALSREPLIVAEHTKIAFLLAQFQQGASHFAIASFADGRVAGFLTMEDVFEAIFGEILDEHEPQRRRVRPGPRWEGASLIARGDTPLFRLERELNRTVQGSEDIGTISGLLMAKLDRVPRQGDSVHHDALRFDVLDVRGRRPGWVRISSEQVSAPLVPPQ